MNSEDFDPICLGVDPEQLKRSMEKLRAAGYRFDGPTHPVKWDIDFYNRFFDQCKNTPL